MNVYIAGGSTGNSLETTVVQLAADALGVDIDDVNTIQGDTAVTGFGAGAAGSRSASMTAGAVRDTVGDPARPHRRRSPRTGSRRRADDIEIVESRAIRSAARPRSASRSARSPTLAYFEPAQLPPGIEAGLEASARATPRPRRSIWVNATPRVHRARST